MRRSIIPLLLIILMVAPAVCGRAGEEEAEIGYYWLQVHPRDLKERMDDFYDLTGEKDFQERFVVYRVPRDTYVKAVNDASIEHVLEEECLKVPRTGWQKLQGDLLAEMATPGLYALIESDEDDAGAVEIDMVNVCEFFVLAKALPDKAIAYVVDSHSGAPLEGADVMLRMEKTSRKARTDRDGVAVFEDPETGIVVVTRGQQTAHCALPAPPAGPEDIVYITTDRPVYRPGHTVKFKAVMRSRNAAGYHIPAGKKVRVHIEAPQGTEVQSGEYAWNDAGSISGTFELDAEPPLGTYRVVVHVEQKDPDWFWFDDDEEPYYWQREFQVEAYRKPEFSVDVESKSVKAAGGDTVRTKVHVNYFFGRPVEGAEVSWTVLGGFDDYDLYAYDAFMHPFEPSGWPGIDRNDPRAWFFKELRKGYFMGMEEEEAGFWAATDVASGSGRTGPDGTLEIQFQIPKERPLPAYKIRVMAADVSGYVSGGIGTLTIGRDTGKLSLSTPRKFCLPRQEVAVRACVVDLEDRPLRNRLVEFTSSFAFQRANPKTDSVLEALARERRPDDDFMEELPFDYRAFASGKARTDRNGIAEFKMKPPQEGLVVVTAVMSDRTGRVQKQMKYLWVAGNAAADMLAEWSDDDEEFELPTPGGPAPTNPLPERSIYEEGETAKLMVAVPEAPVHALLLVEGSTIHEARSVHLKSRCEILEVPIGEGYAPNVFVRLISFKKGRRRMRRLNLAVYPRRHFVDVEVSTDKQSYGAGEKARVTIRTVRNGRPVPAEVELGIVDEAVFRIKEDETPDIRTALLKEWTEYEYFSDADEGFELGGAAGEGFELPDAALEPTCIMPGMLPATRKWFPDTFFWSAHVRTKDDGRAVLDLETPDSLTEWRVVARATAGTDGFGWTRSETATRKDVVLRLIAPRFYTEGDEGTVSTIVHNDTRRRAVFTVRLQAGGATPGAALRRPPEERRVTIDPCGVAKFDWVLQIGASESVKLTAQAISRAGSDAMEIAVPVRPWGMVRHACESGRVEGTWRRVFVLPEDARQETAELNISAASPGISAIEVALPFLAGYPYGCVEQTMSRFLPSTVALRAMKKLKLGNEKLEKELPSMTSKGLQRLYGFQHQDGGWGWWKHDKTDPFMTAYVVFGLAAAKKAGVEIDDEVIAKGARRLKQMKPNPFSLYTQSLAGVDVSKELASAKNGSVEDAAYLVLAGRKDLFAALPAAPDKKVSPVTVKTAALVVRAIAAVDPEDPRIGKFTGWLMEHRQGDAWFSTLDSAYAVYALAEVTTAPEELNVQVRVNGRDVALERRRASVPGAALKRGENVVEISKQGNKPVFASAALKYYTTKDVGKTEEGPLELTRRFVLCRNDEYRQGDVPLESGASVQVGDQVAVDVDIRAPSPHRYVMIESPIAAGLEPRLKPQEYEWEWNEWFCRREFRDDRVSIAAHRISNRKQSIRYYLRPTLPGTYRILPASAFAMYDPDTRGTSKSFIIRVRP